MLILLLLLYIDDFVIQQKLKGITLSTKFKKKLSDFILPIPLDGEGLIVGDNKELKIKVDTSLFEGNLTTEGILSLKDNKPIRYDGSFGIKHSNFGVFLSNFNVQNFNPLPFNNIPLIS